MPKVNAVICAYWPERVHHIQMMVDALNAGTVVPDSIFVLNNNPDLSLSVQGAHVVSSQVNFECRGKFIFAFMDVADYYLILDDDTSVGLRTLECFLRYAHRGCCFGYLGVVLRDKSFHHGDRIWPHEIIEETPCDTFCGCGMFMAFDSLIRMLILEERVRLGPMLGKWPVQGDDIIAGLANRSSCVPMYGNERFVDLGYEHVAMWWGGRAGADRGAEEIDEEYWQMREVFILDVLEALKVPIPEF